MLEQIVMVSEDKEVGPTIGVDSQSCQAREILRDFFFHILEEWKLKDYFGVVLKKISLKEWLWRKQMFFFIYVLMAALMALVE